MLSSPILSITKKYPGSCSLTLCLPLEALHCTGHSSAVNCCQSQEAVCRNWTGEERGERNWSFDFQNVQLEMCGQEIHWRKEGVLVSCQQLKAEKVLAALLGFHWNGDTGRCCKIKVTNGKKEGHWCQYGGGREQVSLLGRIKQGWYCFERTPWFKVGWRGDWWR